MPHASLRELEKSHEAQDSRALHVNRVLLIADTTFCWGLATLFVYVAEFSGSTFVRSSNPLTISDKEFHV